MNQIESKEKIDGKVKYDKICVYCLQEVSFYHGKKPERCPYCGAKNYIKPPTETKLFILQNKFLATRNKEYLSQMFILLKSYASSIIKKLLPKSFTYNYEHVDEKAEDVATLFIEYYLAHPEFKIEKSFGGLLQWRVKEVLWNKKDQREDNHSSLDKQLSEDEGTSGKEMLDIVDLSHVQPFYGTGIGQEDRRIEGDDLVDGLCKVIESISETLKSYNSKFIVYYTLLGICLSIENHSSLYMDKFYHKFGSTLKEGVDLSMLLIYRFIKEHE